MSNDLSFVPESLQAAGPLNRILPGFTRGLAEGSTASKIMRAAVAGDAAALRALLAKPDALPDFANAEGITPLMAATARGHAGTVELLAAHPLVNLARGTQAGWTALHIAAALNQKEAAKALLDHRAPFNLATREGKTAFDLAQGKEIENVFWQDRRFAQGRKRPTAPEPAPVPQDAPDAGLKDAFFKAVVNIGLEWQRAPGNAQMQNSYALALGALPEGEFKAAYEKIRDAQPDFDWRLSFFAAAKCDNAAVMAFLHEKKLFSQPVLDGALALAVGSGDNRDAVHHLLRWGADPNAPVSGKTPGTIHALAFKAGRTGCFEEIALVSRHPVPKKDLESYQRHATRAAFIATIRVLGNKVVLTPENLEKIRKDGKAMKQLALSRAADAGMARHALKGAGGKRLRAHFSAAAGKASLLQLMAAYSEARTDRFFRGTVGFSDEAGGNALALALLNERYTFARMLIGDGYHLGKAAPLLRRKLETSGSPAARKFAEDHLTGKMAVKPLENIGRIKATDYYPGMFMGRMGY